MSTVIARGPGALFTWVGQLSVDQHVLSGSIIRLQIVQSEGSHDEVTMQMTATPSEMTYDTFPNKTAYFAYGQQNQGRFYGYVVDLTPVQKYGDVQMTYEITLQGVTMPLKSGRPRFFTNVGADQVVARIAKEHQLGFSDEWGSKHYIWPQLAQTDESDWEFITTLCDRIGAVLVCSHGVLRIINPINVVRRCAPLVFTSRDATNNSTELLDFSPTHYSERLPSTYSSAIGYLANGQANIVGQLATLATPRAFDASTPVRNQTEAEMAQVRLPVDWEEQSTARLRGDHRVEPGSLILFKSNLILSHKPKYDGLWYVWRVQHNIETRMYQTKVDMARVSRRYQLPEVAPRFWFMGERGRPQIVMGKNGQWMSTWR